MNKKQNILFGGLLLMLFGGGSIVFAALGVPAKLSYQGRLTDTSGNPLTGTYCVRYSIYDAASSGTKLWPAGTPTATSTAVSNGVFNAPIGEMDSLASYDFSQNNTEYLNVEINNVAGSGCTGTWESLAPRQAINASAYALVANSVYGGNVQVGTGTGVTSGQKLLNLDVKNVSETLGAVCSPSGSMWYNSGNGAAFVCEAGTIQRFGDALSNNFFDVTGPTTAVKTFTFPNFNTSVLTSSSTIAVGDLLYASSTSKELSNLAAGTSGYVLTSNGAGKVPSWQAAAGGGGGLTVGSTAVSGGSVGSLFFHDTGNVLGEATNVGIDTGNLNLTSVGNSAVPAAAPAGTVTIFGRDIAGRIFPAIIGPSGLDTALQPLLARNKIGYWNPPGNATTVPGVFAFTAPTAVGTATARTVATTNVATRMRRLGYVSAATAGSLCGQYVTVAQYTIGTGAGLGGFTYVVRFVPSSAAALATSRMFVGLSSSVAAPTNVEPNTLTNSIGVAKLSTSQNLQIVYGGSAAQTAINLGASFGADTLSTEAYELALFASPYKNNEVNYQVTRLSDGTTASGTLTAATPGTQLPASTTLLAHRAWKTNNATAQAMGIDIASVYIETDQ